MEFVHPPYKPKETIAAIATPPGEGGVAMIRIAGEKALEVAQKVFSRDISKFKTHTAYHGWVLSHEKEKIDEVLLIPFYGLKSFCGEDTVEIFCHGGSLIARKVLDTVLKAGAKLAAPGEFSFKAFINGKLDLSQAEAIQALIHAKNEKMLFHAEKQLEGSLSNGIKARQKRLNVIAAILEAWVDFPDEGLEFEPMEKVISDLESECDFIGKLIDTYNDGKILFEGIRIALIGAPNVGKSSLMNVLLDKERAIVSPLAGTTRDVLEETLRIKGMNILLTDTAGIRETDELIEKEGIKRSQKAWDEADLILLVIDLSKPLAIEDESLLKKVNPEKTILVGNKSDLGNLEIDFPHFIKISALNRRGIEELKEEIDRVVWKKGPPSKEELIITHVRHKEALEEARLSFSTVASGLKQGISPEFISSDMRTGLKALGKIIGTHVTEDILSAIFNKFCIGK